jgi:hypothetical protein
MAATTRGYFEWVRVMRYSACGGLMMCCPCLVLRHAIFCAIAVVAIFDA